MKAPSKQDNRTEKADSNKNNNGKGDTSKTKPEKTSSKSTRCRCSDGCYCTNSKLSSDLPVIKGQVDTKKRKESKLLSRIKSYSRTNQQQDVPEIFEAQSPSFERPVEVVTSFKDRLESCPCREPKVVVKKGKKKSAGPPCGHDKDCTCMTGEKHDQALRSKVIDLDNAIKIHGKGKKRKSTNVQSKSIQISEIYQDPNDKKKKSRVTLTEKSKVKLQIKTFSDDTAQLEKGKKKKQSKGDKKSKKSKDKKGKNKSKKPKDKKSKDKKSKDKTKKKKKKKGSTDGDTCCCFRKNKGKYSEDCSQLSASTRSYRSGSSSCLGSTTTATLSDTGIRPIRSASNTGGKRRVDTKTKCPNKCTNVGANADIAGMRMLCCTEKNENGITNTNTVIFPENFVGKLGDAVGGSPDCASCRILAEQMDRQGKEIEGIRHVLAECLQLLKGKKTSSILPTPTQLYMLSDVSKSPMIPTRNYCNLYSTDSKRTKNRKSRKENGKESSNTYSTEYKVRDWIEHASQRDITTDKLSTSNDRSKGKTTVDSKEMSTSTGNTKQHHARTYRIPDELLMQTSQSVNDETFLNIYDQQDIQIFRVEKPKKDKKIKDKTKTKHLKTSKSVTSTQSHCDRVASMCQCSSSCRPIDMEQTSSATTKSKKCYGKKKGEKAGKTPKVKKKGSKSHVKEKKPKKHKKGHGDSTDTSISSKTSGSTIASKESVAPGETRLVKTKTPPKIRTTGCFSRLLKCICMG